MRLVGVANVPGRLRPGRGRVDISVLRALVRHAVSHPYYRCRETACCYIGSMRREEAANWLVSSLQPAASVAAQSEYLDLLRTNLLPPRFTFVSPPAGVAGRPAAPTGQSWGMILSANE